MAKKVFKNVSLPDLYHEIHKSSSSTSKEIFNLVNEMRAQFDVGDPTQSPLVVPLIKDCLALSVKNNEVLVKLTDTIQKAEFKSTDDSLGDALTNIRAITNG